MWTPPRSLTFCERMKLTYTLFLLRLPMPGVWLMALWSSGATVSFNQTNQLPASLLIESGNATVEVTVTTLKRKETAL